MIQLIEIHTDLLSISRHNTSADIDAAVIRRGAPECHYFYLGLACRQLLELQINARRIRLSPCRLIILEVLHPRQVALIPQIF